MKSLKRQLIETGSDSYVDMSWINVETALNILKESVETLKDKLEYEFLHNSKFDVNMMLDVIDKHISK